LILVLEEEGVLHQIERTKSAFYPHRETPIAVEYFSAHRQSVLGSFLDQVRIDKLNAYWRDFRDDDTTFAMYEGKGLFLYKGQERLCPIDEMSSGEQGVVSIAMQLLRNPFEGLILIDEPEQHLHPRWQGRVVRAIRKLAPTSQVIVATHADDPWEDAMSWERRLLPDPRRKNI
jgi:predicted ATPase